MKKRWAPALVLLAVAAVVAWCWHPVCVPIHVATPATNVAYSARAGERLWGVQTFQLREGQWCQCKPWLARQVFF
jgi:hypothetical protein